MSDREQRDMEKATSTTGTWARDAAPPAPTGVTLGVFRRRRSEVRCAVVDDGDRPFLSIWKWHYHPATGTSYPDRYAGLRVHADELETLARIVEEARRLLRALERGEDGRRRR